MQKLEPRPDGLARKQRQRFQLCGMAARDLDRVFYAQHSCPTGANDIMVAVAFPMPATVDSKNVHASRCQLLRHSIPGFAVAIALMKQQHARAWLGRSEISCFQKSTVGAFQI